MKVSRQKVMAAFFNDYVDLIREYWIIKRRTDFDEE
jgi:hypothetical protein